MAERTLEVFKAANVKIKVKTILLKEGIVGYVGMTLIQI